MSAPMEHVPPPDPPRSGELPEPHLPPWDREAVERGEDLREKPDEDE